FEVLKGRGPKDLVDLSVALTARMLVLGGVSATDVEADARVRAAIQAGSGLEKFRQMIEEQGGDPRVVDQYDRMPSVRDRHIVRASRAGYVTRLDAQLIGRASVALGAGRDRVEDRVDPAVGIMVLAPLGQQVAAGDAVLEMHYRDRGRLQAALVLA